MVAGRAESVERRGKGFQATGDENKREVREDAETVAIEWVANDDGTEVTVPVCVSRVHRE